VYSQDGEYLMMKSIFIGSAVCAALITNTAFASETEDVAAGIKCIPAKKIIKLMRKFDGMKPEKKDTVSVIPKMQLIANEGATLPDRVYVREGTTEHRFNMDEDGVVTDFARIGSLSKKGVLCMQGQQFIGKTDNEFGINLSMAFDVKFKNTSGTHSMAELIDGTKDGKSHFKKMFPGPMALMVPKMTHVGVVYLVEDDAGASLAPQIYATKDGAKIPGLLVKNFGGMLVVGLEDLQNLGADGLKIEGGAYELTPIPSIEKMKKLGFSDSGEEEKSED